MATEKSLSSFTDEDLRKELSKRAKERREKLVKERAAHCQKIAENIGGLLPILHHTKRNCTDASRINAYDSCVRCTALEIQQAQHMNTDFELEIYFVERALPDEDDR